jgi:hypothetical protein
MATENKRVRACVPCRIAAVAVLLLLALLLVWWLALWQPRESWQALAAAMTQGAKLPAGGACCAAQGCCGAAMPMAAPPLMAWLDHWPLLVLVALVAGFVLLLLVVVFALGALGLPVGVLAQLGPLLQLLMRLAPDAQGLARALRDSAAALDLGQQAGALIGAGVTLAAARAAGAADALEAVPMPWARWELVHFKGPLYYVRRSNDEPPPVLGGVADLVDQVGTELTDTAAHVAQLQGALAQAAAGLRLAADVLDPP